MQKAEIQNVYSCQSGDVTRTFQNLSPRPAKFSVENMGKTLRHTANTPQKLEEKPVRA